MGYRGQMPQQMQRGQGQYRQGGRQGRGAQGQQGQGPQQGQGKGAQAQNNRQQGFKMNPGVRNPGQQGGAAAAAAVAPAESAVATGAAPALTTSTLADMPPQQQKQVLGEKLYALISATNPSQAGKITGMLLELDTAEVLHLIDTPAALADKVTEAIEALNAANRAANGPPK